MGDVVIQNHGQLGLAVDFGAEHGHQVGHYLAQVVGELLEGVGGTGGHLGGNQLHAPYLLGLGGELVLELPELLIFGLFELLAQDGIFVAYLLQARDQVLGVAEQLAHLPQQVELLVHVGFGGVAGHGLDAAHARAYCRLARDFEEPDFAGGPHVDAPAQLHGVVLVKGDDAHELAVLFPEQGHCAQALGLGDGHVAALVQRNLLADALVHELLNLAQLLVAHLGEVREVEAQQLIVHQRAFLLHVLPQDAPQRRLQQMGSRVIAPNLGPARPVDTGGELAGQVLRQRQFQHGVHNEVVFLLRINDAHPRQAAFQVARVADLPARFGVERRLVEHKVIFSFTLLGYLTVAQQAGRSAFHVVAHEHGQLGGGVHDGPVALLLLLGVARTVLLGLQLLLKAGFVHRQTLFAGDEGGQVQGEAERVGQFKSSGPVDGIASGPELFFQRVKPAQAVFQRLQKANFLLLNHALHELLLRLQLGEHARHLVGQHRHQLVQKRLLLVQRRKSVAHGTAQNSANHVAGLHVGGQLPVGNREADGPDMVGNNAGRNVGGRLGAGVGNAGFRGNKLNQRLKYVGVVVGPDARDGHHQALEAHAGIDVALGQGHERLVGQALELHEHQVPDFHDLRVVGVDQCAAGRVGALLGRAQVDVDFGAGAAGAGFAHLPEVVLLVAVQDAVLGHVLLPELPGFIIGAELVAGIALKHRNIETIFIQMVNFRQQLPGPGNGFFLEVVAERPVAQHLEQRVVVGVVAYFLQIVVLARHAQALLRVGHALVGGGLVAEEVVLERGHARVDEQQGRVVLEHQRGRGHDVVALGGEEIQKLLADVGSFGE